MCSKYILFLHFIDLLMPRVIQFDVFIIFISFNVKIFFHSNNNNFFQDIVILILTSILLLAKVCHKYLIS